MDTKALLELKHTLRFNKNGKFKILMMSDLHGGVGMSEQLPVAVRAMVEHCKPDLVLLGGDTSGPGRIHVESQEDLRAVLDIITAPMEENKIPWAHVFGNHDNNYGLMNEAQEPVYESYSYCVSKRGDTDVSGVANYVLPILASQGDKIKFNVFGLDSHNDMREYNEYYGLPQDTNYVLPQHFCFGRGYDTLHFDQVRWYYTASEELERRNGEKIPALMYMHIPIPELCLVLNNRNLCNYNGNSREQVGCGEMNSGVFSACIQRGDVKAMFFGHDHVNDFTGTYCGIMLGYDAGMDYNSYQDDDLRGARVFELDENQPDKINTYMVRVRDLLGAAGDKIKK